MTHTSFRWLENIVQYAGACIRGTTRYLLIDVAWSSLLYTPAEPPRAFPSYK